MLLLSGRLIAPLYTRSLPLMTLFAPLARTTTRRRLHGESLNVYSSYTAYISSKDDPGLERYRLFRRTSLEDVTRDRNSVETWSTEIIRLIVSVITKVVHFKSVRKLIYSIFGVERT